MGTTSWMNLKWAFLYGSAKTTDLLCLLVFLDLMLKWISHGRHWLRCYGAVQGDMVNTGVGGGNTEETHREPSDHDREHGPTAVPGKAPHRRMWSVIFLCLYGFVVQLKPGEPFITPLLLSTEKNFTREQVSHSLQRWKRGGMPVFRRGSWKHWH